MVWDKQRQPQWWHKCCLQQRGTGAAGWEEVIVLVLCICACMCMCICICKFFLAHSIFKGEEVGRPLLLDEDVQASVQLCLHQQEGLPDG